MVVDQVPSIWQIGLGLRDVVERLGLVDLAEVDQVGLGRHAIAHLVGIVVLVVGKIPLLLECL